MENLTRHSLKDCTDMLHGIFGEPEALLNKFAPHGWEKSPLYGVHHPTAEEQFRWAAEMHENIQSLTKALGKSKSDNQPPRLEDFVNNKEETPVKPYEELIDILGNCTWHIFSENHEVTDADGNVFDLGSWRGSADFIAEYINRYHPLAKKYDYLNFYMGFLREEIKAKCLPVFEYIFETLKAQDCDWTYSFPGMYLISFDKEEETADDPASYNPSKAMESEIEKENRRAEVEKYQAELDEIREAEMDKAKHNPPPVVQAYRNVYGRLPQGFPGA